MLPRACCLDVFVEDENACKAALVLHVKIGYFYNKVQYLLFIQTLCISNTGSYLKISSKGMINYIKNNAYVEDQLLLHYKIVVLKKKL